MLIHRRECLYLKIDADNLLPTIGHREPRTLTELGETAMRSLAQLEARRDQAAVHFETAAPLELEKQIDSSRGARTAAQDRPSAAEKGSGEALQQLAGFFPGNRLHLQSPGNGSSLQRVTRDYRLFHAGFIGRARKTITCPAAGQNTVKRFVFWKMPLCARQRGIAKMLRWYRA